MWNPPLQTRYFEAAQPPECRFFLYDFKKPAYAEPAYVCFCMQEPVSGQTCS